MIHNEDISELVDRCYGGSGAVVTAYRHRRCRQTTYLHHNHHHHSQSNVYPAFLNQKL